MVNNFSASRSRCDGCDAGPGEERRGEERRELELELELELFYFSTITKGPEAPLP